MEANISAQRGEGREDTDRQSQSEKETERMHTVYLRLAGGPFSPIFAQYTIKSPAFSVQFAYVLYCGSIDHFHTWHIGVYAQA